MNQKARVTREEAEEILGNIEARGEDASELREAMEKTVPGRRPRPTAASILEGEERPMTAVARFWEMYHSLPEPVPLSSRGKAIKRNILKYCKEHNVKIAPSRDIDRFAEALSGQPYCPWGKGECVCYDFAAGGPCKGGLLVR